MKLNEQLEIELQAMNLEQYPLVTLREKEFQKIFSGIFLINYLSNRAELHRFFQTDYYQITFSCIIESYHLLIQNYPRGSLLILRSAIENYFKHLIASVDMEMYKVHDRVFNANKITLDKISNQVYVTDIGVLAKAHISRLESVYGKLSGLSHSLTAESKSVVRYFSDIKLNNELSLKAIQEYGKVIDSIVYLLFPLCYQSFVLWEKNDFEEILDVYLGKKAQKTMLGLVKGVKS
ncbi:MULTISPECIES: hypothetical protein [Bacillus cereus group]|jgi:hypothetical protein|uniref:hypothetical protein n=1 Tax=Bacillus cereus group TaxID=86661 RepID=UPI000C337806|nr:MULTISPECIES: hypothetical protein [Bacillus cereus group]AUD23884.1 hypothetical protein CU648_15965 [Bacillus sp. HBCD-sjtu]NKW87894.1 hypothetical protein [Bacillus cereus]HDR4393615.1 hypothetical protein [Bacillus cereus]HDR4600512.1 hypothetical protein [Bacillus cereus]HDR4658105.1 hypothetical protein [Bacillus cereus]